MTVQTLEFRDSNLAITAMLGVPVPPVPGVDYGLRVNPDTGIFEPVASVMSAGGAPAQEFLIGGKQWNVLNHTLGTDKVQAIITLANPVEYASADGSMSGSFYPKYEPVSHGIVQGAENNTYIVNLSANYPAAESIYVLLFAVGTEPASTPGGSTGGSSVAPTGNLTFALTPQPARTGTTYTYTISGAEPGEGITMTWQTSPNNLEPYTYTANNQGQAMDTDVVGSAGSPVGTYSGTISSASGKTTTFRYTLG